MHHFGAKKTAGIKTCTILVQKASRKPKHALFWCKDLQLNNYQSDINRTFSGDINTAMQHI